MSKQKEKKLKKLRKQKVGTYIFGILLVVVVFSLLAMAIMAFFGVNSIYSKVQQGYDYSLKIAEVMNTQWDETNPDSIKEICDTALKLLPCVQDVCVVDGENEVVCRYAGEVPDWNYDIPQLSVDDKRFILANEEDNLIYIDENNEVSYRIQELLFNMEKEPESGEADVSILESEELARMSFWYQIPLEGKEYSVCVKNVLSITGTEMFFISAALDVIIVLALILLVYYVFSVVSLLVERRKLAKIVTTDVVTGGFNLQYFMKKGNKLLKNNRKGKYKYAVVNIRMEKYRNFCSCYGVKEGEELLESFYQVMQNNLQEKEILAYGEKADFALLLTYHKEEDLIERLMKIIGEMERVKSQQKKYFSVGICKTEQGQVNIDHMYNCAGIARNTIMEESDHRIVWFNEEMQNGQLWIRKVENDMEKALINKEFQVYLQPKYNTKEEVLSGAEALVRWIHPTEGFVPPYRFIPIFENNGFIIQLDDYMLTEVARQQAKWIAEGKKVVPISVNVSRVHFVKEDLAEHICQIVDAFHVPHEVIELELTESAFFDDKEVLLNTIKKLKAYGFAISMDDFGSGYSSLNSLKELPLDVVKLDAGFFREEDEAGRGKLIVEDTISLAKKLDMKIVAEGIETREQVDFLAAMDCDLIQGYYFAKPMPITEFEEKAFSETKDL